MAAILTIPVQAAQGKDHHTGIMTRLYINSDFAAAADLVLPDEAAHHARSVLRLTRGEHISVFNGTEARLAEVIEVNRQRMVVRLGERIAHNPESPLNITLVQSISRGERMDYTIQKAVELGVNRIVPVLSRRTVVKFDHKREAKRLNHWRGVIQHAAEQSGRVRLPELTAVYSFDHWLRESGGDRIALHPAGKAPLAQISQPRGPLYLLAGPEGGFDPQELDLLRDSGVVIATLGPRILRTETAALCALSVLQTLFGDLG